MHRAAAFSLALCVVLSACTLSRPDYVTPPVAVGTPDFMRALEAHTSSGLVEGNRADVLLNGDEIFPAMLAAIRAARRTITFANFLYEEGEISRQLAAALAERCRAGVTGARPTCDSKAQSSVRFRRRSPNRGGKPPE
jgi:phosphatidylserine/phosphatidylglycerophosphate/cardiolipin synthase-like enzyme